MESSSRPPPNPPLTMPPPRVESSNSILIGEEFVDLQFNSDLPTVHSGLDESDECGDTCSDNGSNNSRRNNKSSRQVGTGSGTGSAEITSQSAQAVHVTDAGGPTQQQQTNNRPPLAPTVPNTITHSETITSATTLTPTPTTSPINRHGRTTSQGDQSTGAMSALTDPLVELDLDMNMTMDIDHDNTNGNDQRIELPQRNRCVSWGNHCDDQASKSILQPILTTNSSSTYSNTNKNNNSEPQQVLQMPLPPPRFSQPQRDQPVRSSQLIRKLTITEVVDPIESEAETAILAALESREKELKGQELSTAALVLPNMTLEAVSKWKALATETHQDANTHENANDATALTNTGQVDVVSRQPSMRTASSSTSSAAVPTHDSSSGKTTIDQQSSIKQQQRRFASREASKRTLGAAAGSSSESRRQLKPQPISRPPPLHRRTTTSATLSSLATMMRNIQETEPPSSPGATSSGNTPPEAGATKASVAVPAERRTPAPIPVAMPKTQSDSLANNAALLFRGNRVLAATKDPSESLLLVRGKTSGSATNNHNQASIITSGASDPKKNDDAMVSMTVDGEDNKIEPDTSDDVENGGTFTSDEFETGGNGRNRKSTRAEVMLRKTVSAAKEDWESIRHFLRDQKEIALSYAKHMFCFLIFPATCVAALLFYIFSNPSMQVGYNPDNKKFPSVSWFILFLCVRQAITFSLARATEILVIDLVALKTRLMIRVLGPLITLVVVQSKGWPFTITWWAVYDLCMLSGEGGFANHWMFYQDIITMFNDSNPSGNITNSDWNFRILYVALVLGLVVALKRFFVGLYLGGRQYSIYGSKLAAVIHKMIVISQVAGLARQLEWEAREKVSDKRAATIHDSVFNWDFRGFDGLNDEDEEGLEDEVPATPDNSVRPDPTASEKAAAYSRVLSASEKFRIANMLESWEEPHEDQSVDAVSVSGILQFKQSLTFMDLSYPFSKAFGLADSRESCVQSAEEIYQCLVRDTPDGKGVFQFETLSALAKDPDTGDLDEKKLKDMVKIFRPERDGTLSLLEFVRSIDRVYKDLRLLRASIRNSSCIDQAFEALINAGFYFIVFCVVLVSWGIDPLKMFLSLSSVILAFSFAIGSASAKYFEGLMFILLRNPYDIGDRISIDGPNDPPGMDGVFTWFVEDVSLYYTTVRLGATNECATIANSSLALSRIVNAARSRKAVVYINLKFGLDVPYTKIQVFKTTVESFVKARPREWLSCQAIQATSVEADLGFIAYVVVLQHRDSWQHVGGILESKAAVVSFCLEVQKQLGMRYRAPPTPVDLSVKDSRLLSSMMQSMNSENAEIPSISDRASVVADRNRTQSDELRGVVSMFEGPVES